MFLCLLQDAWFVCFCLVLRISAIFRSTICLSTRGTFSCILLMSKFVGYGGVRLAASLMTSHPARIHSKVVCEAPIVDQRSSLSARLNGVIIAVYKTAILCTALLRGRIGCTYLQSGSSLSLV